MKHQHPETHLERSAGILLHITSLPGRFGIGDLGDEARHFVDLLATAGLRWWQILPLTAADRGNNPYVSCSAFAGFPLLISPLELLRAGLLERADLRNSHSAEGPVDFALVRTWKHRMLRRAWEHFRGGAATDLRPAFASFCRQNAPWLDDYALFMVCRRILRRRPWQRWPKPLALRRRAALAAVSRDHEDLIHRERFIQFLFFRQYAALRGYANTRGVRIFGDVPIFVSGDSADVWANRRLFKLDARGRPRVVGGVPPDMFSRKGQRWGNPLYDWPAMKRDGYTWWMARMRATLAECDLVRIDHFRAFAAAWEIPAGAPDARRGRWVPGPGADFFRALRKRFHRLPVVVEDLGVITPDVEKLRDDFHLAGMRVLQFGFDGSDNPHAPENHIVNAVAYTGTHDTDTTAGWWQGLDEATKERVRCVAAEIDASPGRALIRLAWESPAAIAIAPMQDVLELDTRGRMNVPGRARGNWRWRMAQPDLDGAWVDWLGALTVATGRSSGPSGVELKKTWRHWGPPL